MIPLTSIKKQLSFETSSPTPPPPPFSCIIADAVYILKCLLTPLKKNKQKKSSVSKLVKGDRRSKNNNRSK